MATSACAYADTRADGRREAEDSRQIRGGIKQRAWPSYPKEERGREWNKRSKDIIVQVDEMEVRERVKGGGGSWKRR